MIRTLVPVLGLALAAGCGGASPPGVANLGATTAPAAGGPSSSATGSSGGGSNLVINVRDGAKFAACMRGHGVPSFPDPSSSGAIQLGPRSGLDPRSPKFQAAALACRKTLPNGGRPTPQQQAELQQRTLAFSACMRKHGLPDFPDPIFSNGRSELRITSRAGDLDPQSSRFQAAQKACQGNLPGKLGG